MVNALVCMKSDSRPASIGHKVRRYGSIYKEITASGDTWWSGLLFVSHPPPNRRGDGSTPGRPSGYRGPVGQAGSIGDSVIRPH